MHPREPMIAEKLHKVIPEPNSLLSSDIEGLSGISTVFRIVILTRDGRNDLEIIVSPQVIFRFDDNAIGHESDGRAVQPIHLLISKTRRHAAPNKFRISCIGGRHNQGKKRSTPGALVPSSQLCQRHRELRRFRWSDTHKKLGNECSANRHYQGSVGLRRVARRRDWQDRYTSPLRDKNDRDQYRQ